MRGVGDDSAVETKCKVVSEVGPLGDDGTIMPTMGHAYRPQIHFLDSSRPS